MLLQNVLCRGVTSLDFSRARRALYLYRMAVSVVFSLVFVNSLVSFLSFSNTLGGRWLSMTALFMSLWRKTSNIQSPIVNM